MDNTIFIWAFIICQLWQHWNDNNIFFLVNFVQLLGKYYWRRALIYLYDLSFYQQWIIEERTQPAYRELKDGLSQPIRIRIFHSRISPADRSNILYRLTDGKEKHECNFTLYHTYEGTSPGAPLRFHSFIHHSIADLE